MPQPSRLFAAASAVAFALVLAGCASTGASPEPTPTAAPSTPAAPTGSGDFVPDEGWFSDFAIARDGLSEYVGWWNTQECTYTKVIDGDFNCTIHIAGIQEQLEAVDSFLARVVDIAPGSEDLVAELVQPAQLSAEAAAATAEYSSSGCDFSPGESCSSIADTMVELGVELDEALAGWEAPALG